MDLDAVNTFKKYYLTKDEFDKLDYLFKINPIYNPFETITQVNNFDFNILKKYKFKDYYLVLYHNDLNERKSNYILFFNALNSFIVLNIYKNYKRFSSFNMKTFIKSYLLFNNYDASDNIIYDIEKNLDNNITSYKYDVYYDLNCLLVKHNKQQFYDILFNYSNNNISILKKKHDYEPVIMYEPIIEFNNKNKLVKKYKTKIIEFSKPKILYLHFDKESNQTVNLIYDTKITSLYYYTDENHILEDLQFIFYNLNYKTFF